MMEKLTIRDFDAAMNEAMSPRRLATSCWQ